MIGEGERVRLDFLWMEETASTVPIDYFSEEMLILFIGGTKWQRKRRNRKFRLLGRVPIVGRKEVEKYSVFFLNVLYV